MNKLNSSQGSGAALGDTSGCTDFGDKDCRNSALIEKRKGKIYEANLKHLWKLLHDGQTES